MYKEIARRIASAAHHVAEDLVRAHFDLPAPGQDQLYNRIYLGLLEDFIGHGNLAQLRAAFARP